MLALITGGRDFSDSEFLLHHLDRLRRAFAFDRIVQGGAKGADMLAAAWAKMRGLECETVHADWFTHGKAAGAIRNQEMLTRKPDLVIAFPGGRGTSDMVSRARRAGIEVVELSPSQILSQGV